MQTLLPERERERIDDAARLLAELARDHEINEDLVLAYCIRSRIGARTPHSMLLQHAMDVSADQYLSEEFYDRYPELLEFLAVAGCNEDEVHFRNYVRTHPDIFRCRSADCGGTIVGNCPKMWCDRCGRLYTLSIDGITGPMCSNCVAYSLRECDGDDRDRRFKIYAVQ